MPGGIVSEDVPEAPGPNATMQFGEATRSAALLKEAESAGSPRGAPPGGGPSGMAPGQGTPMPGTVQPTPPLGRRDVRPGGDVLNVDETFPPLPMDDQPWRMRLAAKADHPQAGPYLRLLRDLALGRVSSPAGRRPGGLGGPGQ